MVRRTNGLVPFSFPVCSFGVRCFFHRIFLAFFVVFVVVVVVVVVAAAKVARILVVLFGNGDTAFHRGKRVQRRYGSLW